MINYTVSDGVVVISNENGISEQHNITDIKATFDEDRENMIGVVRITNLEVVFEPEISDINTYDKITTTVFNKLADKEYFSEEPNWKDDAAADIASEFGANERIVTIN